MRGYKESVYANTGAYLEAEAVAGTARYTEPKVELEAVYNPNIVNAATESEKIFNVYDNADDAYENHRMWLSFFALSVLLLTDKHHNINQLAIIPIRTGPHQGILCTWRQAVHIEQGMKGNMQ